MPLVQLWYTFVVRLVTNTDKDHLEPLSRSYRFVESVVELLPRYGHWKRLVPSVIIARRSSAGLHQPAQA
jgi:hypothetical protein